MQYQPAAHGLVGRPHGLALADRRWLGLGDHFLAAHGAGSQLSDPRRHSDARWAWGRRFPPPSLFAGRRTQRAAPLLRLGALYLWRDAGAGPNAAVGTGIHQLLRAGRPALPVHSRPVVSPAHVPRGAARQPQLLPRPRQKHGPVAQSRRPSRSARANHRNRRFALGIGTGLWHVFDAHGPRARPRSRRGRHPLGDLQYRWRGRCARRWLSG